MTAVKKGQLRVYYKDQPAIIEGLIVDGIAHNLLSINERMNEGKQVLFKNGQLQVKSMKAVYYGEKQGKLHTMKFYLKNNDYACNYTEKNINEELWHIRLGHMNRKCLNIMKLSTSDKIYNTCMRNKSTRLPFKSITKSQSKDVGELIHSDIAGPMKVSTKEGHRYYQTILDDYSHFTQTYLLVNKSEAADNLIKYIREIETEKGINIKRIRCDNGGEYSSNMFKKFCSEKGIIMEYTLPIALR